MQDATMIFSFEDEEEKLIHDKLVMIYDALKEKGYNPVNQIVGYLLTEADLYHHEQECPLRHADDGPR